MIRCPGCGALVPEVEAPGHRYIGCAPGCWALFGEVLAREYSDFRYARAHRLTVDTYAVQHPGTPTPQSIASVSLHLLRLYWMLELGHGGEFASDLMRRATRHKSEFTWLEPPATLGTLTVLDVHRASGPEEHVERVRAWALDVWRAWAKHHETIRHRAQLVEAPARR